MDKYRQYNEGSHRLTVPELRAMIRKFKRENIITKINTLSKERLIDFCLKFDILKSHFTEKNMPFPPPADSVSKKRPDEEARDAAKDKVRAEKATARAAAKAERKANPKKRGRKPKAAPEPVKKEEPVPEAIPEPKKVGRRLKAAVAAAIGAEPPKEEKNGLTSAFDEAKNKRVPLAKFLRDNKDSGLSKKLLKGQYIAQLAERKIKEMSSAPAAAPAADKKKRSPNAFAMFVKANKKPGMSMKDVAELYKNSKEAAKEEPKKEAPALLTKAEYRALEEKAKAKKPEERTRDERLAIKYMVDREMEEYFAAEEAEKKRGEETKRVVEARGPLKPARERFKLAAPGAPSIGDEEKAPSAPSSTKPPVPAAARRLKQRRG